MTPIIQILRAIFAQHGIRFVLIPQQPVTECCFAGTPLMHIANIPAIFPDIGDDE